jgi:hypothetical protein
MKHRECLPLGDLGAELPAERGSGSITSENLLKSNIQIYAFWGILKDKILKTLFYMKTVKN